MQPVPEQRLAGHLHVDWTGEVKRLLIDGEVFGFFTVDGFHVSTTKDGIPGVTLTIAAERVTVEHAPFLGKVDANV